MADAQSRRALRLERKGLASKVTIIGLAFVGAALRGRPGLITSVFRTGAATEGRPYKGAIKEFRLLGHQSREEEDLSRKGAKRCRVSKGSPCDFA